MDPVDGCLTCVIVVHEQKESIVSALPSPPLQGAVVSARTVPERGISLSWTEIFKKDNNQLE